MNQPGFLGTGASLASDLSLMAYLLLIVPAMLVGFFFARRKKFEPHHKMTMTTITLINWVIIFFLMMVSYREGVLPWVNYAPADPRVVLPTIHLITGLVAQLLGSYLVFRMWFEKVLPQWMMVKRIKRYMRFTLAMWLITATLGITIYFAFYVRTSRADDNLTPVATPDVTPDVTPDAGAPVSTSEISPVTTESVEANAAFGNKVPAATEDLAPVATDDDDDHGGRNRGSNHDDDN